MSVLTRLVQGKFIGGKDKRIQLSIFFSKMKTKKNEDRRRQKE